MTACHKEIKWKAPVDDLPLTNQGVVYDVREVTPKEAKALVDKVEAEGVISEITVEDKGFSNPVMFLRKIRGSGVRKVMNFCLLNAYS